MPTRTATARSTKGLWTARRPGSVASRSRGPGSAARPAPRVRGATRSRRRDTVPRRERPPHDLYGGSVRLLIAGLQLLPWCRSLCGSAERCPELRSVLFGLFARPDVCLRGVSVRRSRTTPPDDCPAIALEEKTRG